MVIHQQLPAGQSFYSEHVRTCQTFSLFDWSVALMQSIQRHLVRGVIQVYDCLFEKISTYAQVAGALQVLVS